VAPALVHLIRLDRIRRFRRPSEGRYFQDLILEAQVCQPEPPADETAVVKEPLDLARCRIGTNIEILGRPSEEKIPDTAAHQVRYETPGMQPVKSPKRIRTHLLAGDAVLLPGNDPWLHGHQHTTPRSKIKGCSG